MSYSKTYCKYCGARIRWVPSAEKRRPIPVEYTPEYYVTDEKGPGLYVLQDGTTQHGWPAGDAAEKVSMGYVAHFASCPGAEAARKKW